MRSVLSALLVLLPITHAPAQEPGLRDARQRWLKGNYVEAQEQYEKLAMNEKVLQDPKLKAAVALGLSQCLQSQGEYDKALETIDAAVKDATKDARLHA